MLVASGEREGSTTDLMTGVSFSHAPLKLSSLMCSTVLPVMPTTDFDVTSTQENQEVLLVFLAAVPPLGPAR